MKDETQQQQKRNLQQSQKQQQDLVDLPDQVPQSPWKQLVFTPKFMILIVLAVGFVGRNVYLEYTKESSSGVSKQQNEKTVEPQISSEMYSRFFWYIILTVIFFVVFILLKRSNDKAEQQRVREQVKKQQEETQKKKKIQEKANRILTSMDQFGNVVDQEAFKKKDQKKVQNGESKKDK